MKWKELLKKVNTKKYAIITNVKEEVKFKSNFKNWYESHAFLLYAIIIAIIALVIYTYRLQWYKVLIVLFALVLLATFIILRYTYSFTLNEKGLKIKFFQSEVEIPLEKLLNIFVLKDKNDFLFFIRTYKIGVIFENTKEKPKEENKILNGFDKISGTSNENSELENAEQILLTLPTAMVNKKDIAKLFKSIDVKVIESQQKEEDEEVNEKKKTKKAILITVLIFALVALITGFIIFAINTSKSN